VEGRGSAPRPSRDRLRQTERVGVGRIGAAVRGVAVRDVVDADEGGPVRGEPFIVAEEEPACVRRCEEVERPRDVRLRRVGEAGSSRCALEPDVGRQCGRVRRRQRAEVVVREADPPVGGNCDRRQEGGDPGGRLAEGDGVGPGVAAVRGRREQDSGEGALPVRAGRVPRVLPDEVELARDRSTAGAASKSAVRSGCPVLGSVTVRLSICCTICGAVHVSPASVDLTNAIARPCGAVEFGPVLGPVPVISVKKS